MSSGHLFVRRTLCILGKPQAQDIRENMLPSVNTETANGDHQKFNYLLQESTESSLCKCILLSFPTNRVSNKDGGETMSGRREKVQENRVIIAQKGGARPLSLSLSLSHTHAHFHFCMAQASQIKMPPFQLQLKILKTYKCTTQVMYTYMPDQPSR